MEQFECDGCQKVIERESIDDLDHEFCSCKQFMGWIQVGSKSWFDLHDRGISPMSTLIGQIRRYKPSN